MKPVDNLPGFASIRRRLQNTRERRAAEFEVEVLAVFSGEGLKPKITGTPDCRIHVGGRIVDVEIRSRTTTGCSTAERFVRHVIRDKEKQLRDPGVIALDLRIFGILPDRHSVVLAARNAMSHSPVVRAVLVWWADQITVINRTGEFVIGDDLKLGTALRAALD